MEEGRLTEKSIEDGAGNAHGDHRGVGGACDQGAAARAGGLARRRRRHAQSDPDADAGAAAGAGRHRDRRRGRLVGRCAGGAGLRLSRRAHAQGPAAHLSHHDRRAAAAHRRGAGAQTGRRRRVRPERSGARQSGSHEIADDALDALDHPRQIFTVDLVRRVARPMVMRIAERRGVGDHQGRKALLRERPMVRPGDARHRARGHAADAREGGMRAEGPHRLSYQRARAHQADEGDEVAAIGKQQPERGGIALAFRLARIEADGLKRIHRHHALASLGRARAA